MTQPVPALSPEQLAILQLGQILTTLNESVRQLALGQESAIDGVSQTVSRLGAQVEGLALQLGQMRLEQERDRAELRRFTGQIRDALRLSATSESQELRAAGIRTPVPPAGYSPRASQHGPPRPPPKKP